MIPSWIWTTLVIALEVTAVLVVILILRRPREPRAMLAWILTLLLLPLIGVILFLLFGEPRKGLHRIRRRRRRARLQAGAADSYLSGIAPFTSGAYDARPAMKSLIYMTEKLGGYPPTHGNDVTIYHDAEKTFLALRLAIQAAQSHIHLEYYIFQSDETGQIIRDLLIERARQGVEVRLLLDFVGCWRLSRRFLKPLKEAGARIVFDMPMVPWRGRWRVNFRNHRKILIVDGRIGFTGSQNIGDEYHGRFSKLGPFRDTHLKIVGAGVRHLQDVFVHDWHYATREMLLAECYFPKPEQTGDHIIQIVPSGPDQAAHVMHQLLFAAVGAAQSSISVVTPYFVPDASMVLALQSAAYRGVRVRLLVPTCTDHRFVLWAGRSFYPELSRAGVRIYEHDETMLHSKVMIVDESWGMVGSANMDERSFLLNFELTAILYSDTLAQVLHEDFEMLRARSRPITRESIASPSLPESLLLGLARLASPLL